MKEQSTTKGFAILSAAGMLVKILSLLYIPFLRLVIGDEGYGIYGAAYQVYVFVFVITNAGIPVAISKLISELTAVGNYKDAIRGFKIARFMLLVIGVIMAVLLMIFAYPLSRAVHYNKAYLSILALSPAVLFTSVASAYRGYFQGRGNMTPTALSQIIEQVFNTIFGIIFAIYLMKYGVEVGCVGGPIGTSLGALFSATFLMLYYEKNKRIKVPKGYTVKQENRIPVKTLAKKIIKYGVPITICVGMTYAGNIVDLYNTKVRLMAGGITEVNATILYGCLVKYQQLMNVPIAIITSLSVALLPAISAAAAIKDRDSVRGKIDYAYRTCFIIAFPCAVGLAVLSDGIFKFLKFGPGAYIMAYGAVVLIFMAVMQIQTTILQSVGRLYTATIYSMLGIGAKIVTNYFLIAIPSINILGAVAGSIVGFAIPIILNQRKIKRVLKVRISLAKHMYKPTIASAIMGVVVYIVFHNLNYILSFVVKGYIPNAIAVMVSIILGGYVYLYGLVLTKDFTKEELKLIPYSLRKFIPSFILNKIQ